ncbi:hypothetical protein ACFPM1_03395 [Halorubrum rubrum]|uniref:DUF6199 domain-containing protein n=1 Tax=Halorubrum rubrum TaxID=1126240 RepID=A0ABD5QYR5_9EURY|nr:hypothetical protein [Halorubrum rubrum]
MTGIRELLAVAIGTLFGLLLIAAPRAAVRLSVFVGPDHRRGGEYGTDASVPDRWLWIVRGLGVACLAVAAVVGYRAFSV